MVPASIRYKNPGAMWGSKLAIKWGASPRAVTLNDGKGQGNNIAVFPTYVQGICAQLDLWRTSPNYRNKRFADAIAIWSGHNEVPSYIAFVKKRVPGLTEGTIMDDAFWRSPMGIAFLKAQAWHEAGIKYPAPDEDWIEAQRRVMQGVEPEEHEMVLTTVWLQKSLNTLGARIEVDGVPGPQTRAAIKLFETAVGLPPDGIIHQEELDAINKALKDGKVLIHPEAPEIKLPPPGAEKPSDLAPTFWGRVWNLFKPRTHA